MVKAWVSLQENNAIGVLDLEKKNQFVDLFPMGYKDIVCLKIPWMEVTIDCAIGQDSLGRSITECAKDAGMINISSWRGYMACICPMPCNIKPTAKPIWSMANEGMPVNG